MIHTEEFYEEMISELEADRDDKERQLTAMQQVLALVLHENGEPVTLLHESVVKGLPEGTQIFIDEDPITHDHTLGLVYDDVDNGG